MCARLSTFVVLGLLAVAAPGAWGKDLFRFDVGTITDETLQESVGGSRLPELVEDFIQRQRDFSPFVARDIFARLSYAGVDDAIHIILNAEGTEATLIIPPTGFSRRFTAAHEEELADQITDFLLAEGSREYAQFQKFINSTSPVAVTDGNPRSTTAFMAEQAFDRFGLDTDWISREAPRRPGTTSRLDLQAGTIRTRVARGSYIAGALGTQYDFGDQVSLSFAIPAQYRRIEGARIYDLGTELALPIRIIPPRRRALGWQVTPIGQASVAYSRDLAAGAVIVGGGMASSVAYRSSDSTSIVLGHQLTHHQASSYEIGGYHLDAELMQSIFKTGLKITHKIGPYFTLEAGAVHTRYLKAAAVRSFVTPGVAMHLEIGRSFDLRAGYSADLASGFRRHGGQIMMSYRW